MCAGNAGRQEHHAREEAKRQQARADEEARRKQAELERLARERQAQAAQQQAQLVAMQRQQAEQDAAQRAKVAEMQGQQEERLAGINARGTAVTQSLQVLARQRDKQGRTASVDSNSKTRRGASTTTAGLRMGSRRSGAGSGANISV